MSGPKFNMDEIFRIAVRIEQNGAVFYQKAAQATGDAVGKELLGELAKWEVEHQKTFTTLREQFQSDAKITPLGSDPDDLVGQYLQSIADGNVFDLDVDPADLLAGTDSLADILDLAIEQEKNSIVFYLGMKHAMAESIDRERVDRIINEEMGHITSLSRVKNMLKA